MGDASFAILLFLEDGVKFREEIRTETQILKSKTLNLFQGRVQDGRQPQTSLFMSC